MTHLKVISGCTIYSMSFRKTTKTTTTRAATEKYMNSVIEKRLSFISLEKHSK